jgi:hypothetical protein
MRYSEKVEHSDENIRDFLESGVPIELHCVYQPEGRGGLIHSYEVLVIEDDELNKSCINYLKRQNIPVFEYLDDMDEYEKELQKKYKNSLENSEKGAMGSKIA